jgi:hypothetical protein
LPIPVYIDNQAALRLSKNPVNHKRSKHIDLKYWFILGEVNTAQIKIVYIPTDENLADIFTKSTDAATFARHMGKLISR